MFLSPKHFVFSPHSVAVCAGRCSVWTRQNCLIRLRDTLPKRCLLKLLKYMWRGFYVVVVFVHTQDSAQKLLVCNVTTTAWPTFCVSTSFRCSCSKCLFQPHNTTSFLPLIGTRNCKEPVSWKSLYLKMTVRRSAGDAFHYESQTFPSVVGADRNRAMEKKHSVKHLMSWLLCSLLP